MPPPQTHEQTTPRKLRVLDLFSGIGGFSLGLERTGGFETVAFCEIDPFCRGVLAHHWPEVPIHDDVTTMEFFNGQADVITGGFPCQDISVAGKGDGIDGVRSGLWSEIVRALSEIRPKYGIFENSQRLTTGDDGRWFATVLRDLAALGFDAEWHCIPASFVGAPHARDRVWIIVTDASRSVELPRGGLLFGWGQQLADQAAETATDNRQHVQLEPKRLLGYIGRWALHRSKRDWHEAWHDKLQALRSVDDGVPRKLERRRSGPFGNAVVPVLPEMLGTAILAAETTDR